MGEYGRLYTIREVVYQRGQFHLRHGNGWGGQYNYQNIYNMRPTPGAFRHRELGHCGKPLDQPGLCPVVLQSLFRHLPGQFSLSGGDSLSSALETTAFTIPQRPTLKLDRRRNSHARPEKNEPARGTPKPNEPFAKAAAIFLKRPMAAAPWTIFNTPPQPSFDSEEMRGSMQAILAQNVGEYVVIEFLIGTEQIIRKQGNALLCGTQLCKPFTMKT